MPDSEFKFDSDSADIEVTFDLSKGEETTAKKLTVAEARAAVAKYAKVIKGCGCIHS